MKKVSIVIPYYKSYDYLISCLDGLNTHSYYPIFEVILVIDGSPDANLVIRYIETFRVRAKFPIRVINRKANRKFAYTCNEGAAKAKGDDILFLNADTVPQGGWLTALMEFAESHPEAGVLGSLLLFPGNAVQHAGGVFSPGMHTQHLYYGESGFLPFVRKDRRLQWITGACMLVSRRDFDLLSGFNEKYISSGEDVDLCFRVRTRLHKEVWVVGGSVLYHCENVTGVTSANIERTKAMIARRWGKIIEIDEQRHYEEDGFSAVFLELICSIGLVRNFALTYALLRRLELRSVASQEQYVRQRGKAGLIDDLRKLSTQSKGIGPFGEWAASVIYRAHECHDALPEVPLSELFKMAGRQGMNEKERRHAMLLLQRRLDESGFLTGAYNLASTLAVQGKTGAAESLYRIVAEDTEGANPDLVGKSFFKLAQLEKDPQVQIRMLRQCLKALPSHNAAQQMLRELKRKASHG